MIGIFKKIDKYKLWVDLFNGPIHSFEIVQPEEGLPPDAAKSRYGAPSGWFN